MGVNNLRGTIIVAIGMLLILEGIMPVIAPRQWRNTLLKLTQLSDVQVRWVGVIAMILGIVILQINR
ncbi:hypothetical protein FERRO_18410 [Ferrovum sp. JA12]|uniref:DUF2065 domain-containing protein n=1 Tax=Ferrovum sp. JA12 TaxID=1356299 RepID=UPI000713669B|nr:hypothetical protein FERRO_18410 [Ferrovum sp. JA12]